MMVDEAQHSLLSALHGNRSTNLKNANCFLVGRATLYDTSLLGSDMCWVTVEKANLEYTRAKKMIQAPIKISNLSSKAQEHTLAAFVKDMAHRDDLPVAVAAARLAIKTFALRMIDSTHHLTRLTPQPTTRNLPPLLSLALEAAERSVMEGEISVFWAMRWLTTTKLKELIMPSTIVGARYVMEDRTTDSPLETGLRLCLTPCDDSRQHTTLSPRTERAPTHCSPPVSRFNSTCSLSREPT
jgi:hypothetical protein